jgi:hypothetical protein
MRLGPLKFALSHDAPSSMPDDCRYFLLMPLESFLVDAVGIISY